MCVYATIPTATGNICTLYIQDRIWYHKFDQLGAVPFQLGDKFMKRFNKRLYRL